LILQTIGENKAISTNSMYQMKFINIEKDYFNVNDENMIIIEFQIQIL